VFNFVSASKTARIAQLLAGSAAVTFLAVGSAPAQNNFLTADAPPSTAPKVSIRDLAPDLLRHRIVLSYDALSEGVTADQLLDRVLGAVEALTAAVPVLSVAQHPLEAGEQWAALGGGGVKGGRTSVVTYQPFPVPASVAGVFVDEWTDVVPDAVVTTSMAFHYDAPASAAPNVALLGVAPPGTERWTADEALAIVTEALGLARLRAVDTDTLNGAGQLLPPLYSREDPAPGVSAGLNVPVLTDPS